LVEKKDFDSGKVKFTFKCEENPMTGEKLEQNFTTTDFKLVPARTGMFKLAARSLIENSEKAKEREKISIKYQVLAPETAMVGVV